ncbi:PREDICTED: ubiquitin carboxyl-terminal hydrolase isozyme L3-like [Priapulus caudatus]|uniref:Ubiquitin carboxyl-terminal hydrolase n=1 Tax=Priapulus caudatus TaxID=37621 RepID=A0ABM1EUK1_PRICU|nr:PREDICTED: ubiquitin carboxyl-terminal hydrolase isozyme L3-like [Priapulus caudatus]
MANKARWLPLESNPEVFNKYVSNLGVSNLPGEWQFVDVWGLEPDLLATVPHPVGAVLLLFPIKDSYTEWCKKEQERLAAAKQTVSNKLYYTKQTVGNACGTVALIHALANNVDKLKLTSDGKLKRFLDATIKLDPEARAAYLATDSDICSAHEESAQEGQTEAPSADQEVTPHFVAMVEVEGHLYELDGRKPGPVNHGPSSPETLLQDAARVCKQFMERDPDEVNFTVVALAAAN